MTAPDITDIEFCIRATGAQSWPMEMVGTIEGRLHGANAALTLLLREHNATEAELDRWRSLGAAVVALGGEDDLSTCPYFARYANLPGFDVEAICDRGCQDEPACVTCEPRTGWPYAIAVSIGGVA